MAAAFSVFPKASIAADELPSKLREFTKLAPLGPTKTVNSSTIPATKTMGLSPEEMARRLSVDLVQGAHGKGGYFLTGDLSFDLFRDDCVFEDPTNRVNSLSQYQKALTLLFDPDRSTVELLGNGLSVQKVQGLPTTTTDEREASGKLEPATTTILTGRLRSRGYLKVAPWKPYVKAYETTIVYTLDPDTGLVARQDQTWTKDASEALKETFSPSWNGEAPKSLLPKPPNEPRAVTALFEVLNGRRPNEYSREERTEIDAAIERIVGLSAASATERASANTATGAFPGLTGTWVLVYLQEGPDGAGIDRRIPFFPEFDFNDNFQVFSSSGNDSNNGNDAVANRVTNIGQVLGSLADVRVSGSLREVPSTVATTSTSKCRFEATIEGGRLCFGTDVAGTNARCPVDLPMIRGTGIFDSLYLGDRLRIGQNINGGGARVVQVRL